MPSFWELLIATLGGSAVLLLAVGFLVKALISHLLSKDIDRFKAELQHSATINLERGLADLRQATLEHEVRFRHLHEKRSLVVAELYSKIVLTTEELEYSFEPVEWFDRPPRDEKLKRAGPMLADLHQHFESHRIFFPEPLATDLHSFIDKLGCWFHDYQTWNTMPIADETVKKSKTAAVMTAWKGLREEIPPLRSGLEHEFRALLQGQTPATSKT